MNRKPVIAHLNAPAFRDLVISDIHGSFELFKQLLEKAGWNPEQDRLILAGDLCEKGEDSLGLVRYVMELKEKYPDNVFILMGNCDFIAKNCLFAYRTDFLRQVLLSRRESLLHEMAAEAGLEPFDENTDTEEFCYALRRHFLKELCFLNDLPHVIVTPDRIYAHAGIENEETFGTDFRQIMVRVQFGMEDVRFSKDVVVGHMPVTEYCRRIADFNPRFDPGRRIISIDGGCVVKKFGQLNAVSFFADGSVQTCSVDALPEAIVIRASRPVNRAPFFVNWNQGAIEVLKKDKQQLQVHSPWLNRTFWMPVWALDGNKASDFTNYQMPLEAGDRIRIAAIHGERAIIKKNGRLGWTLTENFVLSDPACGQSDCPSDL